MSGETSEDLLKSSDYDKFFDPKVYLDQFYFGVDDKENGWDYLPKTLQWWVDSFAKDDMTGEDLLDVGTGPNLLQAIFGSRRFKHIYLSDYAEVNRKALKAWLNREEGAWDWKPYLEYAARAENLEGGAEAVEKRVRAAIQDVYYCDVTHEYPLHPLEPRRQFDCVLSCGVLESVCADHAEYERCVLNLASLVKPGGWLLIDGDIGESFYTVGDRRFYILRLDLPFIESAFEKAGFASIECVTCDYDAKKRDESGQYNAEKFVQIRARKV